MPRRRGTFKGTWTLKRHVNPTRVPIETKESYRWLENLRQSIGLLGTPERYVHVGDRESDIYELFCLAQDLGTRFLVRVQTNRLTEPSKDMPQQDGAHRAFAHLDAAPWLGKHCVAIGVDTGDCGFRSKPDTHSEMKPDSVPGSSALLVQFLGRSSATYAASTTLRCRRSSFARPNI